MGFYSNLFILYFINDITIDVINKTIEKIKALLKSLPVDFILEGEEIGKSGGDMEASLMIEANLDYYFVDDIDGEIIDEIKDEEVNS